MGLGINYEASGDFIPYLKYDARAGRWFRKENRDKGETSPVDVTNGFTAVFDLATIEAGWIDFPTGAAPIQITRPISQGIPPKPPGGNFKQGFRMMVALPAHLGGGAYEVSSSAKAMIGAIDALHTACSAAPEMAQGKLPIIAMTGTSMIETNGPKGVTRNYAPVFAIQGWAPRPAALPVEGFATSAAPAQAAAPAQNFGSAPATGSTQVPPPVQQQAPAAADMSFG